MRRVEDIAGALRLIPTALAALPAGPVATVLPPGSGEGIAVATGARGDCWHVVRIEGGIVTAAFARDPGWAMLPLLEPALVGARLEDVATVLRSLGLSAPGTDL
jgi:Ni,Fe-hydrogenase III large subunit